MNRPGSDRELDDEIQHHISESVDLLMVAGWDEAAAREEALRRFGDPEALRERLVQVQVETTVRMTLWEWGAVLSTEARQALRRLWLSPAFSFSVVMTLALGIGAAASVFAVLDAVLLRPLSYEDAERWVEVSRIRDDGWQSASLPFEDIGVLRSATEGTFEGFVSYASETFVRLDGPQAEALSVVAVTPGTQTLLGIPLLMGRGFVSEDGIPGGEDVALLGREYWERSGADPGVIGRTLRLENGPVTVVGVLRGNVRFPLSGPDRDMWLPVRSDGSVLDRSPRTMQATWARLGEGLTHVAGQERVELIGASLDFDGDRSWKLILQPLGQFRANPDIRQALWLLTSTVGAILLIALLNGVNLVLVRASARRREMAVRSAIGGSRYAVLRQLLAEGLVLGALGGSAAVGLGWIAVDVLKGMAPTSLWYFSPHALTLEGRTISVVIAVSLLAGGFLGLAPALLRVLRLRDLGAALAGRGGSDARGTTRARDVMVVTQVALSMTLLVVAGLLTNSLTRLLAIDEGFEYQRVALATLGLSPTRYPDGPARRAFLDELRAGLEADPMIDRVAVTTGIGFSFDVTLEAEGGGTAPVDPGRLPRVSVSEGYLATLGMPLTAGRGFESGDAESSNVIVDQDMAEFLWGTESPVGRRFRIVEEETWLTVVGVVKELILLGRDERAGPYQFLSAHDPDRTGEYVEIIMRSRGSPQSVLPAFRKTIRELDPAQWVWKLRTGSEALAEEEETPRFLVAVMGFLAAIAALLAGVGLYGVLAYSVGRRSREIGIRMALGADRSRIRYAVVRQAVAMVLAGIGLGVGGALVAGSAVESLLFGVSGSDPATLLVAALLLLSVAGAAAYAPAHRATQVDPLRVLNAE